MELTMTNDNIEEENEFSSKRSSSSSPVSDWKYSTYSSSNNEYSKPYQSSVGNKYNDILDSWKLSKDDHKVKSNAPRNSLMRNFDPLFGRTESPSFPSPPERRKAKNRVEKQFFGEHNDSTGLIEDFQKCKIIETPEQESTAPLIVTKPDVLECAVLQQEDNELKECKKRINELEIDSKEKGLKLEENSHQLNKVNEENKQLNKLVGTMNDINQELFRCSIEQLDSVQRELTNALKEKNEIENKYFESRTLCEKLTDELSSLQNQYSTAVQMLKQLEEKCNHLMTENASMEKQIISAENKKEIENEIMTHKIQNKRLEMKIKALENQLEQKNKENIELSSMVDELIVKVHK